MKFDLETSHRFHAFWLFTAHFHISLCVFGYAAQRMGEKIKLWIKRVPLNFGRSDELSPWKHILPSGAHRSNQANGTL